MRASPPMQSVQSSTEIFSSIETSPRKSSNTNGPCTTRRRPSKWCRGYAIFLLALVTTVASSAQTYTVLANFDKSTGTPFSLVQGLDGNFYGITPGGGTHGSGAFDRLTPGGTVTVIHSFLLKTDGANPDTALALNTDGSFYGSTPAGGPYPQKGTIFKITPDGTLTTLHSFCQAAGCPDGRYPGPMVLATDGNFYVPLAAF
jgi:uncharacterized repeat protein (TIGR03803 family)